MTEGTTIIRKTKPDALLTGRKSHDERVAGWSNACRDVALQIKGMANPRDVGAVADIVMVHLASYAVLSSERTDRLEDRLAALEASAKPRLRVKAGSAKT